MTNPESTYAKPFLSVPEQIRRLCARGMECQSTSFATEVLQRYGYYRLSGYWHPFRQIPAPPAAHLDSDGREIRLDDFVPGTSLDHVVALYDFDHALRTRLGSLLSTIEISLRFFVGHRLGKLDKFSHHNPELLGQTRQAAEGEPTEPLTAYSEWLVEYESNESRAHDDFVLHFRDRYGPHLPIWVATEVMSFGVLGRLYKLMPQQDQEILAARFQLNTADGKGDRGALANWLNSLRISRNICAHYGRVWNRVFPIIDLPGSVKGNPQHPLSRLTDEGAAHKLYGVLLIIRYLLLSIAPSRTDVVGLVSFIVEQSQEVGFDLRQLGFRDDWESEPIWRTDFTLDLDPMRAASMLDRAETFTAVEARAVLTRAEISDPDRPRTEVELARAQKTAQRQLLRSYVSYNVVIEVSLGKTKHYPAFQFRDGKIIKALAEINQALVAPYGGRDANRLATALLDWWQTPHPGLPQSPDGTQQSPCDLIAKMAEPDFAAVIARVGATGSFVVFGADDTC